MSRLAAVLIMAAALALTAAFGIKAFLAEQPSGSLSGVVVAGETGSPIPGATVYLAGGGRPTLTRTTDQHGRFRFPQVAAGVWQLEGHSRAHQLRRPAQITIGESEHRQVVLEMPAGQPFLQTLRAQTTFQLRARPVLGLRGFTQESSLQVSVYRVQVEQFALRPGEFSALIYGYVSEAYRPGFFQLARQPGLARQASFAVPITNRDPEGVFDQRILLPSLGAGTYLATVQAAGNLAGMLYNVTDLALVAKSGRGRILAYVADLATGRPVAGVSVRMLRQRGAPTAAATNGQGLALLTDRDQADGGQRFLLARRGQAEAYVRLYQREGPGELLVYAYRDRPIYRPGDHVYLKGILRRRQDGGYRVPGGLPLELRVTDPNGDTVFLRRLSTSRFGSYAADFALRPEAITGTYAARVLLPDGASSTSWLNVASYRKPEFTLGLHPERKRYLLGDTARVLLESRYFFGSPVAGARVRYAVTRSPYYFYPPGEEEGALSPAFAGEYENYEGEWEDGYAGDYVGEGTTVTDRDGRAVISVRTRRETAEEPTEYDYQYGVSATISERSRAEVSAEASFLATRGNFALFVAPVSYLAEPGKPVAVSVQAVDYDGRPVPDVRVLLEAGTETWQQEKPQRSVRWRSQATTGAQGTAKLILTPRQEGSWYLDALARDREGNAVRGRSSLWVASGNAELPYRYTGMELTTDRRSYRVGDTARLVVNTRHPGASALVTLEGLDLVDYRVSTLPNRTTILEIPVTTRLRPNVTATVSYIYDGQFVSGQAPLRVEVAEERLRIRVVPRQRSYQPGEQASLEVTTTTQSGQPTSAELSLGVVDESIYAIKEDDTPAPDRFFWGRTPNLVETAYSFSELFLDDGDKEGAVSLRRRFPDTAYWNPALVTGRDGRGQVTFTVPDTLTTWRITARGGDLQSRFGEARASMLVTRPLLVRLVVPPVLRFGDRPLLSGIVHNRSSRSLSVSTRLELSGLRLRGGRLEGELRIPPGGVRQLEWPAVVYRTGLARLRFYARAGALSDAIELRPQLLNVGREMLQYRAGDVSQGQALENVYLRADAYPLASRLQVHLSPTLAGSLLSALGYLARYPYGCTEQVMSAFLPDVVLARSQATLGRLTALPPHLPDMVRDGLLKLYLLRHADGGWGWWTYDESDPWMTAYVLLGMTIAKEAGYEVNPQAYQGAAQWLYQELIGRHQARPALDLQAFALYSLALAGQTALVENLLPAIIRPEHLHDPAVLAPLALTYHLLGRPEAERLQEALWQHASQLDNVVYWPYQAGRQYTALDVNALALMAALRVTPQDPRIPGIVRWLMRQRTGDHWQSTRQTALIIYAAIPYLQQEVKPDFTVQVVINGRPAARRTFTPADALQPEQVVTIPGRALRRGANSVLVSQQGTGRVYYSLALRELLAPQPGTVLTGGEVRLEKAYYPVRTGRDPLTGISSSRPAPVPATSFRSGEAVLVRLVIHSERHLNFAMVEDPYPAGMQAVELGELAPWEWDRWWSAMDIRDDRVNVPAREIGPGKHVIEYYLRAVVPGSYQVSPALLYEMYQPEVRTYAPAYRVEVRP